MCGIQLELNKAFGSTNDTVTHVPTDIKNTNNKYPVPVFSKLFLSF